MLVCLDSELKKEASESPGCVCTLSSFQALWTGHQPITGLTSGEGQLPHLQPITMLLFLNPLFLPSHDLIMQSKLLCYVIEQSYTVLYAVYSLFPALKKIVKDIHCVPRGRESTNRRPYRHGINICRFSCSTGLKVSLVSLQSASLGGGC